MAVISLLGSVLLIGFALWTMWATLGSSFARACAALTGNSHGSTCVNLSAFQRRPQLVTTRARFSRPVLRAAA